MKSFLALLKASALIFVRSKQALFFSLFMPLFVMVIFGLIGFDKLQQYDIGIVAQAPQQMTKQFVAKLKDIDVLKIHEGTLTDEQSALKNGDRTLVLVVPNDFIDAAASQPQELVVYVNESQPAQSQAIVSMLNQYLDKTSLTMAGVPPYFSIKQEAINSRNLKYIDYLLPGLIAMSVMQMSVFSVAFLFVQYKEKGVLKRLAATPMLPVQFVGANTVTRLVMSVAQAAIFIVVGILMLHAHVIGSYALVLLIVLLGALMFLGLGFTLSGIATTVESVPVLANLIVFPMLFLGGTFFPITGMPHGIRAVANLLPLTFFGDALREVMTEDASFSSISGDLLGMAVWSAVLVTAAVITFEFQERETS